VCADYASIENMQFASIEELEHAISDLEAEVGYLGQRGRPVRLIGALRRRIAVLETELETQRLRVAPLS
jgi:hypothetical protein